MTPVGQNRSNGGLFKLSAAATRLQLLNDSTINFSWRRRRRRTVSRLFHLFRGRIRCLLRFVAKLPDLRLRVFRCLLRFFAELLELRLRLLDLLISRFLRLFRFGFDRLFSLVGLLLKVVRRLFVAAGKCEQSRGHCGGGEERYPFHKMIAASSIVSVTSNINL